MTTKTHDDLPDRPYAVVGASGQQGGATAAALLEAGASVRALVRDPNASAATRLAGQGAQLAVADLDQPAALREAFDGAAAVFAMTTFTGPRGVEGEVEHGVAIGDAARDAGVSHIVYSSVGGAERRTGIPHFESKRRVEEHLESLGLHTIFLRPAFFMDNFTGPARPVTRNGEIVLRMPLPDDVPLQMIATTDIGKAAALALMEPERVPGGAIELAGDELTGEQIAAAHGVAAGLPARYESLPLDALAEDPDQQAMFAWFARPPAYRADLVASRRLVPGLQDLPTWLRRR
jgi:uncharacterized protein YbjT (DUF2867 family)